MGFGRFLKRGMEIYANAFSEGEYNRLKEQHETEREIKARQDLEKRHINEKQIRALRNRYRPGGGLLGANPRGVDVMTSTGLPTKFGTT